jgi:hypothetical protein
MAHSGVRYLVLTVGALVLALSLVALRAGSASNVGRAASRMFRVFVVTIDVQVLIGLAVVFLRPFHPMYIGHIVMMTGALAVAHMFAVRLRKATADHSGPSLIVTGTLLALVLIVGGILAIQRPIL